MATSNKAVALVRVSSDRQAAEGYSLATQEAAVRRYARERKLDLVRVIQVKEGVSARKTLAKRPGGKDLLDMVKAGEVHHVIGTKLDRLFRNAGDAKLHINDWNKRGVSLHLLQFGGSGPVDTASTIGKLFMGILGEMAEFESNMIGDRTKEVKAYKKGKRLAYCTPPYGFRLSPGRLVKGRIIDRRMLAVPSEQKVVKRILALRSRKKPYHAIATLLNTEGVPTKKGVGPWRTTTVIAICNNSIHRTVQRAAAMKQP